MTKRAIVVGINYLGSDQELKGCLNDAMTMVSIMQKNGYNVDALSDAHPNWYPPEYQLILMSLEAVVRKSRPGDQVVFYFSGHGTQVPSDDRNEDDGLDEAIVTSDLRAITDDQLRSYFARLPATVRATAIMDCCHSGTLFDGKHRVIYGDKLNDVHRGSVPTLSFSGRQVDRFIPYSVFRSLGGVRLASMHAPRSLDYKNRDVCILMSACQASEKSKDVQPENAPAFGAFTKALEVAYKANKTAKHHELVLDVRKVLLRAGFSQNPCLECAPALAHVPFLS